jgi:Rieske Fe-S protein
VLNRREFMGVVGSAAAAAAAGCGGGEGGLGPDGPFEVRLALMAVGETVAIGGGQGQGILVTRLTDTSVVAVSRTCTHQGCQVSTPSGGSLNCPCHGSRFTVSGSVVQGPATQPLRSYQAVIEGDEVVVTVS